MGWQSDWLYDLIFGEVRELVVQAGKHDPKSGTAPTIYRIVEQSSANWESVHCSDSALRSWILEDGTLSLEVETEPARRPTAPNDVDGMFFREARVAFHISTDRKRVAFTYQLGPRYGRGRVLQVKGQGRRATLVHDGGKVWIS